MKPGSLAVFQFIGLLLSIACLSVAVWDVLICAVTWEACGIMYQNTYNILLGDLAAIAPI